MVYFTEYDIDRIIEDDVPLGDMTSHLLDFAGASAKITLLARHDLVVCCTEEVERIYRKNGLEVVYVVSSGTALKKGGKLFEAQGDAQKIHLLWRSCLAMIEFASAISTRTRQLVEAAHAVDPNIPVAGTRKHPPYLKKVALKALMAGGGEPHRTGLSDTILIFKEHLLFVGGYDQLSAIVTRIKSRQKERKVVVEAHNIEEVSLVAASGADVVQIDKLTVSEFSACKQTCSSINPNLTVIAAGGISADNAAAYARAGADVLVTSWMYFGPPADIQALIQRV